MSLEALDVERFRQRIEAVRSMTLPGMLVEPAQREAMRLMLDLADAILTEVARGGLDA